MGWILVFLGGGLGATARHAAGLAAARVLPGDQLFWGTFGVNVLGALLMGLLAGWLARAGGEGGQARLLLGVGLLGGFTTFSAFSLETARLLEAARWAEAGLYAGASLAVTVLAVFAGLALSRLAA